MSAEDYIAKWRNYEAWQRDGMTAKDSVRLCRREVELLRLHYCAKQPIREIADDYGIYESHVRSILKRTIGRLVCLWISKGWLD